ncbi:MAG: hypothetical protein CMH61_01110 [Nanoarchaeota archaeon]|nr:hypothetical protein [Nanoarchaeota archaeon]|tara:strand:+ start:761 stop:1168 length:408 start_codon:yes stop_codon:yes gene_type:complete
MSRIDDKLDEIVTLHEELMEDLPPEEVFLKKRVVRRGIEKTVQLIADTIVDVALMIISQEGFDRPQDSRDAIKKLKEEGILTKNLASKIQDFVSFRNLLVHRYVKVNKEEEYENIDENHKDILDFVRAIESFSKK